MMQDFILSLRALHSSFLVIPLSQTPVGGTHMIFTLRGRAAEQGIIFRIPTPGLGIIFVKIGCMTGSIFVIFYSERSF